MFVFGFVVCWFACGVMLLGCIGSVLGGWYIREFGDSESSAILYSVGNSFINIPGLWLNIRDCELMRR